VKGLGTIEKGSRVHFGRDIHESAIVQGMGKKRGQCGKGKDIGTHSTVSRHEAYEGKKLAWGLFQTEPRDAVERRVCGAQAFATKIHHIVYSKIQRTKYNVLYYGQVLL
jgi:hypothetical protein